MTLNIYKNEIMFVCSSQPSTRLMHKTLCKGIDGNDIKSGDIINFSIEGDYRRHCGYVSNINGLSVDCFNPLLNKWAHYKIDLEGVSDE